MPIYDSRFLSKPSQHASDHHMFITVLWVACCHISLSLSLFYETYSHLVLYNEYNVVHLQLLCHSHYTYISVYLPILDLLLSLLYTVCYVSDLVLNPSDFLVTMLSLLPYRRVVHWWHRG